MDILDREKAQYIFPGLPDTSYANRDLHWFHIRAANDFIETSEKFAVPLSWAD